MAWDTAANVLNDAIIELGLRSSRAADPYDITDIAVVQLQQFLTATGQDLLRDYQWSHLAVPYTFPTADGTASYALPADFQRFVDQTAWNRTQQRPLFGPLNAQQWEQVLASTVSGVLNQSFRVYGNKIYLSPTPSAVETVAYEYQSAYWVSDSGGTAPTTDTPDDGPELLYFDRRLLVCGVKLRWLREKGFDSMAAQDDFDRALARALGADGAAPVLSVTPGASVVSWNVPDTGYGS